MKKIVTVGLSLAVGTLFFVGCTPSTSNGDKDTAVEHSAHIEKHMTLQDMHNTIIKAGEDAGWRMTEFKENSLIAEKIGDDTKSITITFSNDHFQLSPENDDLKDAIEDALQK